MPVAHRHDVDALGTEQHELTVEADHGVVARALSRVRLKTSNHVIPPSRNNIMLITSLSLVGGRRGPRPGWIRFVSWKLNLLPLTVPSKYLCENAAYSFSRNYVNTRYDLMGHGTVPNQNSGPHTFSIQPLPRLHPATNHTSTPQTYQDLADIAW